MYLIGRLLSDVQNMAPGKCKRTEIPLSTKYDIIKDLDSGSKQTANQMLKLISTIQVLLLKVKFHPKIPIFQYKNGLNFWMLIMIVHPAELRRMHLLFKRNPEKQLHWLKVTMKKLKLSKIKSPHKMLCLKLG